MPTAGQIATYNLTQAAQALDVPVWKLWRWIDYGLFDHVLGDERPGSGSPFVITTDEIEAMSPMVALLELGVHTRALHQAVDRGGLVAYARELRMVAGMVLDSLQEGEGS